MVKEDGTIADHDVKSVVARSIEMIEAIIDKLTESNIEIIEVMQRVLSG